MNPETHKLERLPDEMASTDRRRSWTQFIEGEIVTLKGIAFFVHEIGTSRIVLKPYVKEKA